MGDAITVQWVEAQVLLNTLEYIERSPTPENNLSVKIVLREKPCPVSSFCLFTVA